MTNFHHINRTDTPAEPATAATSYVYFVGLQFMPRSGGIGFTNTEVILTAQLTTMAEVQLIEKHLHSTGFPKARVMGINLLRTEPANPGGAR